MKQTAKGYDETSMIEKRITYLVGARLRETDKIKVTMKKQDEIRKAHPVVRGWDSVSVIRRWRENR